MAVSGVADLTANFGFSDKRLNLGYRVATQLTEENNYSNINDLDTRLSAINAGYYTVARLQQMSKNDKVYALRVLTADAGGI